MCLMILPVKLSQALNGPLIARLLIFLSICEKIRFRTCNMHNAVCISYHLFLKIVNWKKIDYYVTWTFIMQHWYTKISNSFRITSLINRLYFLFISLNIISTKIYNRNNFLYNDQIKTKSLCEVDKYFWRPK